MSKVEWLDEVPESEQWAFKDARFRIDDVDYVSTMRDRSKMDQLCVRKPPALVEATVELLSNFENGNIVELGICHGGSSALAAQISRPRKLVAFELAAEPVTELQQFIDNANLNDSVRPYYGVDQSDRAKLAAILDDEFGSEPLDLVIDDASHLLDPTRASFEVLFPRLRPGGLFVIEDWNWQHLQAKGLEGVISEPGSRWKKEFDNQLREALADKSSPQYAAFVRWQEQSAGDGAPSTPSLQPTDLLTFLVIELLLARAWMDEAIGGLDILDLWVVVQRGPADLDPNTFRVAHIAHDRFDVIGRLVRE